MTLSWPVRACYLAGALLSSPVVPLQAVTLDQAVGPQYDTAHVYVAPADVEKFSDSFIATFGGHKSGTTVLQVTPTPSMATSQIIHTPVGTVSVFGFKTPIPYPFGQERHGYLVKDLETAISLARHHGAEVSVAAFPDPIGKDAVIEWPGGVSMQLYWHTHAPNYEQLETVPESRVYISPDRANAFVRSYIAFTDGNVVSDECNAPGVEIGQGTKSYRRIRMESKFGKTTVLVTDGHLPFPFGHESTGYEVRNLSATLSRARASGAVVLVGPFSTEQREAAVVEFPGGYIAEVYALRR